jgi:murein L,D-transpeptidase YafK
MKIFLKLNILIAVSIFNNASASQNYLPEVVVQMNELFSHHVLVAEKSTHQLHLFKNDKDQPKLMKTYQMATGKKAGDKIFQGDFRTPEGIYHFNQFLTHEDLIKRHGKAGEIYGVGAFVMNYPNPIDQRKGKTGGGIWLHSTNDETRIDKGLDSRGCIVAHNGELIELSKYIELNRTNMIVVDRLNFLSEKTWTTSKNKLNNFVSSWIKAWEEEDIKAYLSHYHQKEFADKYRGNYSQFKQYKRAVFNNPGKPLVKISNLSMMKSKDYAVATFVQHYESKTIKDVGMKSLYLKRDEYYNWKIVSEQWSKSGITEEVNENKNIAFQPSMRFFTSLNPTQIMSTINEKKEENN